MEPAIRGREGRFDLGGALLGVMALLTLAFSGGWERSLVNGAGRGPEIRLAYFPNITHAPALIGVAKGFFQNSLSRFSLSTKVVNAGPDAMEALLAGELDLAYVGPSPATNTFLKSNGRALQIVSGACSGGASLVARSDLDIRSLRDLAGHSVAVPQLGGTQDVSCRHFLAENGLAPTDRGGSVSIIPLKNPDILMLFKRKQIDAAWVPEPWASRLEDEAGARQVVDERTLWPGGRFTTTVLVARTEFEKSHPDAVLQFVRANKQTIAWIQAHPEDARATANAALKKLTGKALRSDELAQAWSHVEFTADPDPSSVLAFAEAAFAAGYLKVRPTGLDRMFADPSLAALARREPEHTR